MIRTRLILLLLVALSGCATRVVPPAVYRDATTVYLSDYGRHSSLLLPVRGGFNEYAFGDWEFFAKGHTNWWIGVLAIIHSPQSTLGRRFVPAPEGSLTAADLRAQRVMKFTASAPRVEALEMTLDSEFVRSPDPPIFSNYSRLYHVRDPGSYALLHN